MTTTTTVKAPTMDVTASLKEVGHLIALEVFDLFEAHLDEFGSYPAEVDVDTYKAAISSLSPKMEGICKLNGWDDKVMSSAFGIAQLDQSSFIKYVEAQVETLKKGKTVTRTKKVSEVEYIEGDEATTASAPAEAATKAKEYTIKDKTVISTVNLILKGAVGEEVSIEDIFSQLNESGITEQRLTKSLKAMQDKLAKVELASVVTKGADTINGEELNYEVIMKPASDIFYQVVDFKPRKVKILNFQIPTLVWKKADGTEVRHPECPEIDEAYQLTPIRLTKFLTAFIKNQNVWAHGHTGTGKSTFVEQVAARIGFPVSRVNLDSSLERADFVGNVVLRQEAGATVSQYIEGILPRAMQRPGFLLLDEIDAGRPDILFVIQRALEGNGLMLTEDHGRIVKPHSLFRFCATANTRGQGDEFGIYQGTRAMNTAMLDRFPVFIGFEYLDAADEIKLLKEKFPDLDDTMADQIVLFANELRKAFMTGELFQPITPRGLFMLTELFLHFEQSYTKSGESLKWAIEMTVTDKATKATQQKVKELADRCFSVKDSAAKIAAKAAATKNAA